MKTIIAGSRGLSLEDTQAAVAACPWYISAVVGGGAKGPDKHGEQFASATGLPFELYEANWQRDGDQAGFIRNLYMAEVGDALLAVWDGESNGTRHMIETMESRGKPVYVHMVEPKRAEKRRAPDRPTMDFETYSEAGYYVDFATGKVKGVGSQGKGGLPEVGTPAYAEHPTTEVLCLYYDLLDGKGRRGWRPGEPYPADLLNHIANGGDIAAWNIGFERYIWHYVCVPQFGWPVIPLENCYCDMAKSRRFSTPGSLDMAAKVIGGVPKDKKGKDLIRKLTRPHTPTKKRDAFRWTRETAPEDFHALDSYCDTDVESETTTSSFIPDLTDYERRTWLNDQMINERGVQVDIESLDACLDILRQATDRFTQELRQITGGAVSTVNATQQFTQWLSTQGVRTPSIDAEHVKGLLKREDLAPVARRALEIRQSLGSANVKKLPKLKLQVNNDGRLRDQYSYCGADRTGRWSAGGVQLQNITANGPKSKQCAHCGHIVGKDYSMQPMGAPDACPECLGFEWQDCPEWTVEAVEYALNVVRRRNLDELIGTWGDPIAVLCGCLRGLFTAPEGKRLVCCDFSAIEAVVLACLSRCQWRIDVFNTHGKIYEMSASKISGVPFEEFAAYKEANGMHHPLRKSLGKVAELASGYGGWVGAWNAFGAEEHFANEQEIKDAIIGWREASPEIVEFWGGQHKQIGDKPWDSTPHLFGLEGAFVAAMQNPGEPHWVGDIAFMLDTDMDCMLCRLPSGRLLHYHRPRLDPSEDHFRRPCYSITFEGYNSNSQKGRVGWQRMETYGGRLAENVTQAVSADIQAEAMCRVQDGGFPIVMHTHDELTAEMPEWDDTALDRMTEIMIQRPSWAPWWPIRGAGWMHKRYQKD